MSTDKEQLENLMAMAEQSRESQKTYFKNRTNGNLRDAKIKEDALDNLLKHLRMQGFTPVKIVSKEPEQNSLF
jgi:hypothetical protein